MRTAFASLTVTGLTLAALVAGAAQAQTPAAAPEPAPPPAAAPPTPPAAPAADATPAAAAPAPAPAAEAPPPPPAIPTTGDGAVLLNVLEKVCVPLVRGGKLDDLAKPLGMKLNRKEGTWTMPLGGDKAYTVTMFPVGVNKDVCRGEVHYAFDNEKAIVSAFNIWSFLHKPELILQANYVQVNGDNVKRVQKSWEHIEVDASTAVNFTTATKPDDTPLNKGFATGEIFYQERKLTP